MNKSIYFIKNLCHIDGISGREAAVREELIRQIDASCRWEVDNRGNLICHKSGKKPAKHSLMLTAHMDEAGFMLTGIGKDGLLSFSCVGEIDPRVILGKGVLIDSKICGVVGTKPIHLQTAEEQNKPLKAEELSIDIGAESREEAEKAVCLGAGISFDAPFVELANGNFAGKACESRAACALLVELLQADLPVDLTAVFSVSAQTHTSGAANAAFRVKPEIAIILASSAADDTCGGKGRVSLGKGPVLSLRDQATLYDNELYKLCAEVALQEKISFQEVQFPSSTNESRLIQTTAAGTKVLALSLPCRYPNTPSAMMQLSDLRETAALLRALLAKF